MHSGTSTAFVAGMVSVRCATGDLDSGDEFDDSNELQQGNLTPEMTSVAAMSCSTVH